MIWSLVSTPTATAQPDPAWGFGLGGAVFLLSVAMLWAAVHLRGRSYQRLKQPVGLAYEALAGRIFDVLGQLRTEIDKILPSFAAFDPATVIADPAVVAPLAKRGMRIMRERHRLRQRFESLLRVCSVLKYVSVVFTVLVLAGTGLYFFTFSLPILWQSVCWGAVACAVVGAALVATYAVLDGQIQSAIEHSEPEEQPT